MTTAQDMTTALGGEWRGLHGLAPCPVCQIERRADQRALSLRDESGRLLAHCHKRKSCGRLGSRPITPLLIPAPSASRI